MLQRFDFQALSQRLLGARRRHRLSLYGMRIAEQACPPVVGDIEGVACSAGWIAAFCRPGCGDCGKAIRRNPENRL
jgi:hypothetical protein